MTDDPDEICTRAPVRSSPRFCGIPQGDDSFKYFLFIESKVMFHVTSFAKAALFWFSLHYIFNLQYCKQAKEVATFFQEFVVGLPEKSKSKSGTYLTVSSDIFKYVED